jgi:hypothetical protein
MRSTAVAIALCVLAAAPAVRAEEAPVPLIGKAVADRIVGNTVSAVAYLGRSNARGGGSLDRVVFQAFIRQDGSSVVRMWDPARNAYTVPAERRWSMTDNRLCIGVPQPADGQICADVHMWGPRIAGVSQVPYVMLDGDIKEGNRIDSRP